MAQKISIIIPNYNGSKILTKNLPNVIRYSPNSEIIVIDDASEDSSVKIIHKKFKKIKVIRLKRNVGFATAVNKGVKEASGDFIVLLNSDVSPRKNYLNNALRKFKDSKNGKVFAVGFLDYSHEKGKLLLKGRGVAKFKKGLIVHKAASIERGKTLWVSGGSGIFDRKIFQKLGGFDQLYKPFYWEDIDLSFRAWRSGYSCHFEPLSIVDHFHEEGAIMTKSSPRFIKKISYRNQFIFFWKNIDNIWLSLTHLLYLPYHFVKAILNLDTAFFLGFILACLKLPQLIISSYEFQNYIFSENEVLDEISK